jgi:AcrR family transcriptional regulator
MTTRPVTARQRDPDRTRAAILAAAQQAFSTRAYAAVGVRDITAAAGTSVALVNRYFGSKEKLFAEAVGALFDADMLMRAPRVGYGAALVASFVDASADRINPLRIMILAAADPEARATIDRVLHDLIIVPLAAWFGGPDAEQRAARLMLLASGFFLYRLVYPLPAWAGTLDPASRAWLERAFQTVIDDPLC